MGTVLAVLLAVPRALVYWLRAERPAERLNRRGGELRKKFSEEPNLAYLDQAIALIEQAANRVEDGSPNKPIYLTNLGRALSTRFHATWRREDIERAITHLQEAVARTPADSPDRASRLEALTRASQERAGITRP